jgi:cob(I)alamin adenosyltransferase
MNEDSVWVTTRGGDKGLTSLGNGQRVPKDHPRVELYGTLDECQASLGMARATSCHPDIREQLLAIENELGAVMGYLALFPGLPEPDPASLDKIVERVRQAVNARFHFVRPGDSIPGAALHMARTVARRAERSAVKLHREGDLTDNAYAYVNRLSDAVYALSLWSDRLDRDCGKPDQIASESKADKTREETGK